MRTATAPTAPPDGADPGAGRHRPRRPGNAVRRLWPARLRWTEEEVNNGLWFFGATLFFVVLAAAMATQSYDIWGALPIGLLLALAALPRIRRIVRRDDPTMVGLVTAAFFAKLLGSVARYLITFELYDDAADALGYHEAGTAIADGYWSGDFSGAVAEHVPEFVGTPFMRLLTGLFYIVTGPTLMGGFVIFGFLSFIGMFLFYRALRIAFPDAEYRRYAVLLFFLPTLLYWPSSIGKEAWMVFCLGIATYGVALILTHQVRGYLLTVVGMAGTAMVRPHMTALVFAALLFAYLMRRRSWRESAMGPVGKLLGIGILLIAGGLVLGRVAEFFDLESVDPESVENVLEYTEGQSSQGGSEFEAVTPQGPADYPAAFMAVLIRPYLWEAGNPQMLASAAEGMCIMIMLALAWRRIATLPAHLFRTPYAAYCLAFVVMFTMAFSSISNFGNMTRQRTQVFPFVLMVLAIPDPLRPGSREDGDGSDDDADPDDDGWDLDDDTRLVLPRR